MVYESSYESGRQPFLPDSTRGNWLNPHDFIYAGMSLIFRIDILSMTFLESMETGIFTFLPTYLISMAIYIVPLMVIQSFMGQFSSSGFISAFRLSPMFKGIGYVTLIMNICVLAYHSLFAMVPLLYMFASMKPTLPWSCEGFKTWSQNITENDTATLCNVKFNETETYEYFSEVSNETISFETYVYHHIPSVLYFKSLFHDTEIFDYGDYEFTMSWQLILCALLVWTIVGVIVFKYFKTEMIGTLVRYSVWITLGLMAFFVVLFSFLPGSLTAYKREFVPSWRELITSLTAIPIYGLSAFGPGWGLLLTLSSYNRFKTNIIRSSFFIAFGQLAIMLGLDFLMKFSEGFFNEKTGGNYYTLLEHIWILYLSSGSVMAHMAWANLWSILFFFMLFLSSITLMVLQLHSILTSIYDEFVSLREKRSEVAMGVIGFMAVASIYFTSNHGITYSSAIAMDTYVTQTAINLLLILIVLWIYGRVRFQRDIEFMINHTFSTWSINVLRFLAPLGMLLALAGSFMIATFEHSYANSFVDVLAVVFIALPWLSIPGYAIYQMSRSMGTIKTRFLRCCRPTDWFPVEAEERQKYEEAMGTVEITHTLSEMKDEEVI